MPIFPEVSPGSYQGPELPHVFYQPVAFHKPADENGAERGVFHGSSAQW
jgi:hypothetical protein